MGPEQFTFGLKGPDADNFVWLTYDGETRSGMVNLGASGDPRAARALRYRADVESLEREFGHLVYAPA
jgi:hypothetical protein